ENKKSGDIFNFEIFLSLLPIYGIYLLIGLFILFVLLGKKFITWKNFLIFLGGIIAGLIVLVIMIPVWAVLAFAAMNSTIEHGKTLGAIPFIISFLPLSLLQEGFKLLGIFIFASWIFKNKTIAKYIGAIFALGLSFIDILYFSNSLQAITESSFIILFSCGVWIFFHVISGLFTGLKLFSKKTRLFLALLVFVILNYVLHLLPILEAFKIVPSEISLISNIIFLLIFIGAIIFYKKKSFQK
ncbi:MAG: hypothetical protein ABIJ12_13150, partial [bacterium]